MSTSTAAGGDKKEGALFYEDPSGRFDLISWWQKTGPVLGERAHEELGDYAGPDLLTLWYQRKIRIYHNIVRMIESLNDCILVVYGTGHLGWLRQDIANDATVKLRKLADLTAQQ